LQTNPSGTWQQWRKSRIERIVESDDEEELDSDVQNLGGDPNNDGAGQGCQVAVITAPLLKSGRRKILGAVKNSGP
jgi:hypothetical protein